jgi:hypothetical protein
MEEYIATCHAIFCQYTPMRVHVRMLYKGTRTPGPGLQVCIAVRCIAILNVAPEIQIART